jgi:hypothetical protein
MYIDKREVSLKDRITGAKRLETLAEHLKTVPTVRFDLHSWSKISGMSRASGKEIEKSIKKNECGTTACACGHAATIPEFKKLGFRFEDNYSGVGTITFEDKEEFEAAAAFFGLTYDESEDTFGPNGYAAGRDTKYYVIKRLESLSRKMRKEVKKEANQVLALL